jgi:hypothetical protein
MLRARRLAPVVESVPLHGLADMAFARKAMPFAQRDMAPAEVNSANTFAFSFCSLITARTDGWIAAFYL